MLEDLEDDTHLCIKCSQTIVGLENYVRHRKSQCSKSAVAPSLNREIIDTSHTYQSFDFPEQSSAKHEKQFNFNYEIDSVHHGHDDSHDGVGVSNTILPSPMHSSEKASDYKTDPNKSLSESYDYNYGLGADVFFSLLNLQSSSKSKIQTVTSNTASVSMVKGDSDSDKRKVDLSHSEHMDDWIASTSGSDKLMKAVNAISGTKKLAFDSPQYTYEYSHDHGSPEPHGTEYDDDEIDEHEHDLIEDEADDETDLNVPPHTHTGGKWRPSDGNHRTLHYTSRWYERWDISDNQLPIANSTTGSTEELTENIDVFSPPPTHTKGKWVPGTKIIKLDYKHKERHDSESFSEQFWCRSCNRRLSSRIVYERHLKSKLHTKRSQPENDLELASLPLPFIGDEITGQTSKRATPTDAFRKRKRRRKDEIAYIKEHSTAVIQKRKRRFKFIKCDVCKTRLRTFLYGKHLISHYHYRRMFKNPTASYATIINNIDRIVLQSPYQCQICRFYANTEEMFLNHWDSEEHRSKCSQNGMFWCSFCKFDCKTNDEMSNHLIGKAHQEVVSAINRSVPIIIRQKQMIHCEKCQKEFSYNIELRKHAPSCSGSKALGTASDQYQSKHYCKECKEYFASLIVYQRHLTSIHGEKFYFCGPCELSFSEMDAAKRHRVSSEHKVKAARIKAKKSLKRKCNVCGEIQDDLLVLKQHIKTMHPDHHYPCYFCGQKFILPQELSRHIRDKVCKCEETNPSDCVDESNQNLNSMSLLEMPIITDISKETEVTELMDPTQLEPSTSSACEADENYMIVTENDSKNFETSEEHLQFNDDTPVLWACRQCEFR